MFGRRLPDLDIIEGAITHYETSFSSAKLEQVLIKIRLAEVSEEAMVAIGAEHSAFASKLSDGEAASDQAILTAEQYAAILETAEKNTGVEISAAPRLTTLSGREAVVSIGDYQTIVIPPHYDLDDTGVLSIAESPGGEQESAPEAGVSGAGQIKFRAMQIGSKIRVLPKVVHHKEQAIDLDISFLLLEFLGYDDPRPLAIVQGNARSTVVPAPAVPLPRMRHRTAKASAHLLNGQTLMLKGTAKTEVQRRIAKVFLLGDIPLIGQMFRQEKVEKQKSCSVVFVTARILGEAENQQTLIKVAE